MNRWKIFEGSFYYCCQFVYFDNIKFHAHKLRHTFAVNAVRAGIPLNVLQAWLGHSSIFTTSIYTQIAGQDTRGYMERMP